MNPWSANVVSSRATSSWLYRFGGNATAVPATWGAPMERRAIGSADVKYVVSTINLITKVVPLLNPGLANRVRRYTRHTATLCQTPTTPAPAGVRMDTIGSANVRGCISSMDLAEPDGYGQM